MSTFLKKTSYNQFTKLARVGRGTIVSITLPQSAFPLQCVPALESHFGHIVLLEFNNGQPTAYRFIGFDAIVHLISKNGKTHVTQDNKTSVSTDNPFEIFKALRQKLKPEYEDHANRFTGAAIGALAYNAVRYIEELPHQPLSKANVPDIDIYFFRYGIYFDDIQKTTTISKLVYGSTEADYQQALTDMESILEMIQQPFPEKTMSKEHAKKSIQVDLNDIAFEKMVVKAKEYIQQGEVFQMVLSRTFQKEFNQNSFHLYEKLKKENPSLYHFYFKTDHYHLVGASPEKIVSNQKGIITSTPLAGSRSLHDNDPKTTIQNLLADEKERAEHLMLVDLARNDLGRIAVPGSVYVEKLTYPLILKNIVHIASDVKAQLDSLFDVVDVLTTSFPAGTLSGAPKVRAMQLIDELESSDRGFYGGCILAIDHADNMDTCIIIRSALIQDNTIYIRSGCGIVYDSTPLKEVEETRHKAKSMLEAIATL